MAWKWIIYVIVFSFPTVFSKDMARTKRSDEDGITPCEEGWYNFSEKCYKVNGVDNGKNWQEAADLCAKDGGHLVTIESKEENDFLTTSIITKMKLHVWIGLYDREEFERFVWHDGSPANYFNWKPSEPSGTKWRKEICVEMSYDNGGRTLGQWNDYLCNNRLPFICQRRLACGKNMKHYGCMPVCNTCHAQFTGMLCYIMCKPGCFCEEGYVEKSKGECVLPSQCLNYTGHDHFFHPFIGVSVSLFIVLLILPAVICYFRRKQRFRQNDEQNLWLSQIPHHEQTVDN